MNKLIACPIDSNNEKRISKVFLLFMSLFFLLPLLTNTVVIIPVYTMLEANVAYSTSFLTVTIKYVQDFFDLFAFSSAYAMIIFSSLLLSKSKTRFVVIFYAITYFLLIPLKILMNAFIYGSVGTSQQLIIDVVYLSVYFALYMLQLLAVYIFAATDSNRFISSINHINSSKRASSKFSEESTRVLPFRKLLDWYNPLQRSALKMSLLITIIKVGTRIINDISFGAPDSFGEVMIMVVYYLSDLIYGAVAYLVALFIMHLIFEKLKKKDEDVSPSDICEN